MAKQPLHTEAQVREWYAYYTADHARSVAQTAEHFGVPKGAVDRGFGRYHLSAKPVGRVPQDYAADPFGAAAADIRTAVDKALAHDGAMSEAEYQILQTIKGLVA